MKKGRNTAEALDDFDGLDDMELSDGAGQEMALILKAQPPSRKIQLMAHGAREIRCAFCGQIRLIAGAEECDEGWICEYCLPDMMREPRYGGLRGR
jgi:LSD1 subclass zinc finger protein